MIVDSALYVDGRRASDRLDIKGAALAGRQSGAFVWIGMFEPTPEEFEAVRQEFDLHELSVEDAIRAHQRPKLELYGDILFVVLKSTRYLDTEEVIELGEIQLFIGRDFVVHVRHGAASALTDARRRLELRPDLLSLGPGAVLYAVADKVVDDYSPVLAGLDNDIEQLETMVFSTSRENPAARIYNLKREVLEFHKGTQPLLDPLERLAKGESPAVNPGLKDYFRDVHDHLLRVVETISADREILTSILEANLIQVSVRQNEDMRRISAWVAIAAVPTAVAGIYGMNFDFMPELRWRFGYPLVLGTVAAICLWLYRTFRKSDWL